VAKLSEYIKRIDTALQRIDSEASAELSRAGVDLIALVSQRVIQEGETATGGKFTGYSNNQVPAYLYYNKSRSGSAEQRVRTLAKQRKEISYRELRVINGLNVNFKTFEFTGSMWRNIRVVGVQKQGDKYTATIRASNSQDQKKLEGNSQRERQLIIKPSKDELKLIERQLSNWLSNILQIK
jgi:hypothetical protein